MDTRPELCGNSAIMFLSTSFHNVGKKCFANKPLMGEKIRHSGSILVASVSTLQRAALSPSAFAQLR